MILTIWVNNKKGFSLLELTIVVIILTTLLTFAVPSFYRAYLEKAGAKTALEIQNIQDAARSYYLHPGSTGWPTSITPVAGQTPAQDLESNNFLPAGWNALNPFGNSYTISSTPSLLTVSTTVPEGAQKIVAANLSLTDISGTTVTSTIGTPGGPTTPPVFVVTGTIGNGGTIPLPTGYADSQCQWFVGPYNAQVYDSSGKGGCENLESVSTYLTGPNGRTAVATTTGSCRGSWAFTLNYMGICLNA